MTREPSIQLGRAGGRRAAAAIAGVALAAAAMSAPAAVRINEIMAAPSARLLRVDTNGMVRLGTGDSWMDPSFVATNWTASAGTLGFGGYAVNNDLADKLSGPTMTVYVRRPFVVPPAVASDTGAVRLVVGYDSGFIAYINGREVMRKNLGPPGAFAYCDQAAYNWHATSSNEIYVVGIASNLFVSGTNLLAIQYHGYTNVGFFASSAVTAMTAGGAAALLTPAGSNQHFIGLTEPSGGIPESASPPRSVWGLEWTLPEFLDDSWPQGAGGIGFGDGDDATDVYSTMFGKALSLYQRRAFEVTPETAAMTNQLRFAVRVDDGYVAYLNGVEIARSNLGAVGSFVPHDMPATRGIEANAWATNWVGRTCDLLRPGTNVLAIQTHNNTLTSSDLSMIPNLDISDGPTLVVYSNLWRYFVGIRSPLSTGDEEDGEEREGAFGAHFADWIELYNDGAEPVHLTGWSLTDSAGSPRKWVFPGGTVIPARSYLVVLCTGYDIRDPTAAALHTNFKLDADGEYVGLYDAAGALVSAIAPRYPPQSPFHSYAWSATHGGWRYFDRPTPAATNAGGAVFDGYLPAPGFDKPAGVYTNAISVAITSSVPGASIRWTLNGDEPNATNGFAYAGPIALSTTATLRARAFLAGQVPSPVATRSFLVNPPALLRDVPSVMIAGPWETAIHKPNGVTAIVGGTWGTDSIWRAISPDDYNIPMKRGHPYERPVSVEYVYPMSNRVYQTDAGLRLAGSTWTRPRYILQNMSTGWWSSAHVNKPQFNLYFRSAYGAEPFEIDLAPWVLPKTGYESLRLRGGKNDYDRPFIRDELMRRLNADLGQPTSKGMIAALYVNGIFRAYYNPVERYDVNYFQVRYGGTNAWDIINQNGVDEGDISALNSLMYQATNSNLSVVSNYLAVIEKIDPVNLADYILINAYGATGDWPHNNYFIAREKRDGARFHFHMWDAEGAFGQFSKGINFDILYECLTINNNNARPAILFRSLYKSSEFRLLMADRIHKHFFNGGALTYSNIMARYAQLKAEADPLIIHMRGSGITNTYITTFTNWFNQRPDHLFTHFRTNNVWPATGPPLLATPPGTFSNGALVTLANTNAGGSIYYAFDGADPRAPGGDVAGVLYTNAIVLDRSRHIRARVLSAGGEWSAVSEGTYSTEQPPAIVITELYYNPLGGAPLEFVELYNAGSDTIEVAPLRFTAGITFSFSASPVTQLPAGEYMVVVQNLAAFAAAYNTNGMRIAGVYSGRLDNAGERIAISHAYFGPLQSFDYEDDWYPQTDGEGFSLTLRRIHEDREMWDRKEGWKASSRVGGSPGAPDPGSVPEPGSVVINEVLAHTDLSPDGDWVEIHNTTGDPIDVSGWWLSDSQSTPYKYRIADGTVLPANGFLVFTTTNHFGAAGQSNAFSFSEYGESAVLSSARDESGRPTGYREIRAFGPSDRERTFGRHVRSDGREVFVLQRWPTRGGPNAGPRVGPLVISEILYAPPAGEAEFVEVYCLSPTNVPLYDPGAPTNRWQFRGVGTYVFPSGAVATAMDTFVVAGTNPAVFRARFNLPPNYPVYGPFTGRLDNVGDVLQLARPLEFDRTNMPYEVDEEIEYNDKAPWPAVVGEGRSIRRVRLAAFGNDPANWTAGPVNGMPGSRPMEDSDGDGIPDRWEGPRGLDLASPSASIDSDGDGVTDLAEYLAGTDPNDPNDFFRVDVAASNTTTWVSFQARAAAGPGYDGLERRYAVDVAPLLHGGTGWVCVAGCSNLLGDDQEVVIELPAPPTNAPPEFYRGRTWLQPR